jgi:hypothetical protein
MAAIDRMEDSMAPVGENLARIRELISSLELCHHKAERWIELIIEAIGRGESSKGLGTRSPSQQHPVERIWQYTCTVLTAWSRGVTAETVQIPADAVPADQLFARLGQRTALKEWQVQRVIEKIRSLVNWPFSEGKPSSRYVWLLLNDEGSESLYRNRCPEPYREQEDFWLTTASTTIHDTENAEPADLSLALAIDMLWPCHWRFLKNLEIVLGAIGGELNPQKPFAACARNIALLPGRRRFVIVANTLADYSGALPSDGEAGDHLLELLGDPTTEKKWLAASLAKTIRLQLYPPEDLRELSALKGPDWIRS